MTFCSVPLFSSNSYAGVKIPSDLTVYQHPGYSEIQAFLSGESFISCWDDNKGKGGTWFQKAPKGRDDPARMLLWELEMSLMLFWHTTLLNIWQPDIFLFIFRTVFNAKYCWLTNLICELPVVLWTLPLQHPEPIFSHWGRKVLSISHDQCSGLSIELWRA